MSDTDEPEADRLEATVAWSDLLAEATARFERAGLESPQIDARRIVEEATGSEPREFHAVLATLATVRGVAAFDRMVARREAGEPLQYVVGRWAFRRLDLMVDHRVLIPRPETEVVAGLAIDEVAARSGAGREVVVADLGTGSGAIAFSIASECAAARVLATDRSADALAVARANLAGLGRAAGRVSLHEGSWFAALPASVRGAVDVLVSNPPYIADDETLPAVVGDWEPPGALRAGAAGDEDLRTILAGADEWVAPGGAVVLEMAPAQTAPIAEHFQAAGWQASIHGDLAGRDRAVVARKRG
ncbi:MAG: peptide chain release factor N(5)-glutamine methyltransferase [Actinomycetota bacterium]